MTKKSVDLSGFKEKNEEFETLPDNISKHAKGIAGDHFLEPVPHFNKTDSENVFQGESNSWIVLGRDRPNHKLSGYGGKRSYTSRFN